jgi:hypothetical protein
MTGHFFGQRVFFCSVVPSSGLTGCRFWVLTRSRSLCVAGAERFKVGGGLAGLSALLVEGYKCELSNKSMYRVVVKRTPLYDELKLAKVLEALGGRFVIMRNECRFFETFSHRYKTPLAPKMLHADYNSFLRQGHVGAFENLLVWPNLSQHCVEYKIAFL